MPFSFVFMGLPFLAGKVLNTKGIGTTYTKEQIGTLLRAFFLVIFVSFVFKKVPSG